MPETELSPVPLSPREITFEGTRLTVILIAMMIPFYIGGDKLFDLLWKGEPRLLQVNVPAWTKYTAVVAAIFVHELIHGLIFALYAKNGFKAIKFGFSKTMASPYCHCKDPLKVKHYRRAGIAPFIILGLIPLAFAMFTGVNWIKTFGLLFSIGGFGDLLIWIKLMKFDSNLMIRDHPEKMGFIIE
jgi:hypothetical protein